MRNYIPIDLLYNILLRLQIKPLLRCTSVCKSWYDLITSSVFISYHLNSSFSNNENRILLRSTELVLNSKVAKESYYIHTDNQTFDLIEELEFPPISSDRSLRIIGSFNGLICCYDAQNGVILWNPSLRKSVILEEVGVESVNYNDDISIGFGFLPSTNSYKILKIVYINYLDSEYSKCVLRPEVEIYELDPGGYGSWRDVDAGDFSCVVSDRSDQAYLNDIVHWTGYSSQDLGGESLIVLFDMKSEKLGTLMLPDRMQGHTSGWIDLFSFRESLCVLDSQYVTLFVIWQMKEYGVEDSWEMLSCVSVDPFDLKPVYFRKNGEMLSAKNNIFEYNDVGEELVSYDPKTNKITDLVACKEGLRFSAVAYVDSLVLINFLESKKLSSNVRGGVLTDF